MSWAITAGMVRRNTSGRIFPLSSSCVMSLFCILKTLLPLPAVDAGIIS